jgi:hypothetical protein
MGCRHKEAKVPKIKKILPYEMNFFYQIMAASRTPD